MSVTNDAPVVVFTRGNRKRAERRRVCKEPRLIALKASAVCDGWDLVRRFLFSLFMCRHNLLLEAVLKQTPSVRVVIMPLGLQLWESQGD